MKKLFPVILSVLPFALFATHNFAGRLTYSWISGYSYEITVETWTDINSTANRCELVVYTGDGDSVVMPRINGPQINCSLAGSDGVAATPQIRYSVYAATHTFSGPGTYTLCLIDPNREADIVNIPNSINTPFALTAWLYINPLLGNNSSPDTYADNLPIDTAVAWNSFQNNISCSDPDGDSLAYNLISCVGYNCGPIPGYYIPSGIYVGQSGTFNWPVPTPVPPYLTFPQRFDFLLLVKEYRQLNNSWYLIGESTTDFIVMVNGTTGINESVKSAYTVFPNPAESTKEIFITGYTLNEKFSYEVYTVTGSRVCSGSGMAFEGKSKLQLFLPEGFYILGVRGDEESGISWLRIEVIK